MGESAEFYLPMYVIITEYKFNHAVHSNLDQWKDLQIGVWLLDRNTCGPKASQDPQRVIVFVAGH